MCRTTLVALLCAFSGCTPDAAPIELQWRIEIDGDPATCEDARQLGNGDPLRVIVEAVGRQEEERGHGDFACEDLQGTTEPMPHGRYSVEVFLRNQQTMLGEPVERTGVEVGGDPVDIGEVVFEVTSPTPCGAPLVTIAAVYHFGGLDGATFDHDYVVLRNRGLDPYDLTGHSLQFRAPTPDVWTAVPLPSDLIPARGYYLVELGQSGTAGAALPTPDFSFDANLPDGPDLMVALFSVPDAQTQCPTADRIDLLALGFESPCFEGEPFAPASVVPTFVFSRVGGACVDSDQNLDDFQRVPASPPANSSIDAIACTCR